MSEDKTVRCECGFYNRDKFHTKVGGGRCDFMVYRNRIAELEVSENILNSIHDALEPGVFTADEIPEYINGLRAELTELREAASKFVVAVAERESWGKEEDALMALLIPEVK